MYFFLKYPVTQSLLPSHPSLQPCQAKRQPRHVKKIAILSSSGSTAPSWLFLVAMSLHLNQVRTSIDEDPLPRRRAGGLQQGKAPNMNRDRGEMDQRMFIDYFSATPTFGLVHFRRRYRMRRSLFLTIMERLRTHDSYFQKPNAIGV